MTNTPDTPSNGPDMNTEWTPSYNWVKEQDPEPIELGGDTKKLWDQLRTGGDWSPERIQYEAEKQKEALLEFQRAIPLYIALQRNSKLPGEVDLVTGAVRINPETHLFTQRSPVRGAFNQREQSNWIHQKPNGDIVITQQSGAWIVPDDWPETRSIDFVDDIDEVARELLDARLESIQGDPDPETREEAMLLADFKYRSKRHNRMMALPTSEERENFLKRIMHGQRVYEPDFSLSREVASIPADLSSITDNETIRTLWRESANAQMAVKKIMQDQLRRIGEGSEYGKELEKMYTPEVRRLYKDYLRAEYAAINVTVPSVLEAHIPSIENIIQANTALNDAKEKQREEERERRRQQKKRE